MTNGKPANAAVLDMLAAADKARGFPVGTMASVMQQEVGGNVDQYLADPSKYHYEADKSGKRVAPQSGKVSTAFGPFGLLESTAKDPGYGVKPLADKSLEEQVRFAADYLAARTRANGGDLGKGLAGYGEGARYAQQVQGRMGGTPPVVVAGRAALPAAPAAGAPVVVASGGGAPQEAVSAPPEAVQAPPAVVAEAGPDAWQEFLKTVAPMQRAQGGVTPEDLQFGVPGASFAGAGRVPQNRPIDFRTFGSWTGRSA